MILIDEITCLGVHFGGGVEKCVIEEGPEFDCLHFTGNIYFYIFDH